MIEIESQREENPLSAYVTDIPSRRAPPLGTSRIYNMRCPSCRKLYQVQSLEIFSSHPHFQCLRCREKFTFENPPVHPNFIQTFPLNKVEKTAPVPVKPRMDNATVISKLWNELIADYDNVKKHFDFINRCEELQALPFALKRYESMKKAQPHDEVTAGMLDQVLGKTVSTMKSKASGLSAPVLPKSLQKGALEWSPLVFGVGLVIAGLMSASHRNLVGFGVAVLAVAIGMRRLAVRN